MPPRLSKVPAKASGTNPSSKASAPNASTKAPEPKASGQAPASGAPGQTSDIKPSGIIPKIQPPLPPTPIVGSHIDPLTQAVGNTARDLTRDVLGSAFGSTLSRASASIQGSARVSTIPSTSSGGEPDLASRSATTQVSEKNTPIVTSPATAEDGLKYGYLRIAPLLSKCMEEENIEYNAISLARIDEDKPAIIIRIHSKPEGAEQVASRLKDKVNSELPIVFLEQPFDFQANLGRGNRSLRNNSGTSINPSNTPKTTEGPRVPSTGGKAQSTIQPDVALRSGENPRPATGTSNEQVPSRPTQPPERPSSQEKLDDDLVDLPLQEYIPLGEEVGSKDESGVGTAGGYVLINGQKAMLSVGHVFEVHAGLGKEHRMWSDAILLREATMYIPSPITINRTVEASKPRHGFTPRGNLKKALEAIKATLKDTSERNDLVKDDLSHVKKVLASWKEEAVPSNGVTALIKRLQRIAESQDQDRLELPLDKLCRVIDAYYKTEAVYKDSCASTTVEGCKYGVIHRIINYKNKSTCGRFNGYVRGKWYVDCAIIKQLDQDTIRTGRNTSLQLAALAASTLPNGKEASKQGSAIRAINYRPVTKTVDLLDKDGSVPRMKVYRIGSQGGDRRAAVGILNPWPTRLSEREIFKDNTGTELIRSHMEGLYAWVVSPLEPANFSEKGDSGSWILNESGELIGILSRGNSEGIGIVIPITLVIQALTKDYTAGGPPNTFSLPPFEDVTPDTPAETSGSSSSRVGNVLRRSARSVTRSASQAATSVSKVAGAISRSFSQERSTGPEGATSRPPSRNTSNPENTGRGRTEMPSKKGISTRRPSVDPNKQGPFKQISVPIASANASKGPATAPPKTIGTPTPGPSVPSSTPATSKTASGSRSNATRPAISASGNSQPSSRDIGTIPSKNAPRSGSKDPSSSRTGATPRSRAPTTPTPGAGPSGSNPPAESPAADTRRTGSRIPDGSEGPSASTSRAGQPGPNSPRTPSTTASTTQPRASKSGAPEPRATTSSSTTRAKGQPSSTSRSNQPSGKR